MSDLTIPNTPTKTISVDEYLDTYAAEFYEWDEGTLIQMAPISNQHTQITYYLIDLLRIYLVYRNIAKLMMAPFVMRLTHKNTFREPDVQVILHDNPNEYTETGMIGAADICIEVVSPESVERDRGQKFQEYETEGVREYWIIDPIHAECLFYRLNEKSRYERIETDENDHYTTPILPDFVLHVPTLWREELPNILEIVEAMQNLLGE